MYCGGNYKHSVPSIPIQSRYEIYGGIDTGDQFNGGGFALFSDVIVFYRSPPRSSPCRPMLENTPTAPLQRGNTPWNECPGYDTKSSDGEIPVLELWRMWKTSLLPTSLWPRLVFAVLVRSMITQSGKRGNTPRNERPVYDIKQSDGELPVMLGLWGMRSILSLPLLPGPRGPGVVAPDRALSMG